MMMIAELVTAVNEVRAGVGWLRVSLMLANECRSCAG